MTFPMPMFSPVNDPTVVYTHSAGDTTVAGPHSFSSVNFGTEASDRIIVVALYGEYTTAPTVSSVLIGGVSGTQQVRSDNAGGMVEIYTAAVPTGTSGTVSFTLSNASSSGIVVWAMYGIASQTADATNQGDGASINLNINTNTSDILIAAGSSIDGTASCTWTGLTEDADIVVIQSARQCNLTGASASAASSETPRTITCAMTGSNYRTAAVCLWRN